MAIKENATVKVINGPYVDKIGKLSRVYPEIDMAIVSFEDGEVGKVTLSSLVETLSKEERDAIEVPEGGRKITKADFDSALAELTNPIELFSDPDVDPMRLLVMSATTKIVGVYLGKELFKDSDVVAITEDRFISLLWEVCSPEKVSESIGNKMILRNCMGVSISAVNTLRDLILILFGGSEE